MTEKKDGHREYSAERKANILRLMESIRTNTALTTQFLGNPDQVAEQYDLKLTDEEVSALTALAEGQELNEEDLAAVAGGKSSNSSCVNIVCADG